METNLFDRMLDTYMTAQTAVTLTLQNKIRVSGRVRAFDSYVVVIEGQRREILYRHAISSLAPFAREEQKLQQPVSRPAPLPAASRPPKTTPRKSRPPHRQTPPSPAAAEPGINNGMKEGLLRWMQEQKAAK